MSSARPSPIVKMAGLGIVAMGLYFVLQGTHWVSERISELPVQGRLEAVASEEAPAVVPDPRRSLHPLLVESSSKAAALKPDASAPAGAGFDAAFGKGDAPAVLTVEASTPTAVVPLMDYFKDLAGMVRVQAVTSSGAIIGGKYVEVGAPLPMYAYPDARTGLPLIPRLAAVSARSVTVSDAKGLRTLQISLAD